MADHRAPAHLVWRTIAVNGRRTRYGVAGHGMPVLFLHGWGLGHRAYKRALKRVVRLGCRVYAPAMPEFGGTAGLPRSRDDLGSYAAWADAFLTAVGVDEPVLVAGHSLGGAVAARLAHDFPDRVAHLVLLNALGGGIWTEGPDGGRLLSERPLWHWAAHFSHDIATTRRLWATLRHITEDAVPNLVTNPVGVWRAAEMARRVDLRAELMAIRAAGVPVTAVSSEGDNIVPRAAFDALCASLGVNGHMIEGRHSWLLADPENFAAVMVRAVTAAQASRAARAGLRGRVVPLHPYQRLASGQ